MTNFSYEDLGEELDISKLVFVERLGGNSCTVGETHTLLRIWGHHVDGRAEDNTYVVSVQTMAGLIGVLCEQAIRNGQGPELLRLVATDLATLKQARPQQN